MLLADIYHSIGDDFQATNTLQSIIDNYENKDDGIVKDATKMKALIEDDIKFRNSKKQYDNQPDGY